MRYLNGREALLTLALLLAIPIISSSVSHVPVAFAAHSASCSDSIAPPSGYCVTSDFHGTPVPVGTSVTVKAYTTDISGPSPVTRVRFIWHAPDGTTPFDEEVSTFTPLLSGTMRRFSNTHTVGITGDWGVQAIFCTGTLGTPCPANQQKSNDTEAIRATSFEGIPEFQLAVPLMSSITLGLWMLLKRLKNKQ